MRSAISNLPAESLSQLTSLYDKAFVHCAYLTFFGRAPDPEGLHTYCQQLRRGERKISIISQLNRSPEAKAFGAKLPGLSKALTEYRKSRWPIAGRLYLAFKRADGDSAHERQLRSIENAIYASSDAMTNSIERLASIGASPVSPSGYSMMQDHSRKVMSPATAKPANGGFIPA